jgi:hypothetical protein
MSSSQGRLTAPSPNYNDDGSLSGTTDEHYFRLTAYTLNGAIGPRRTPILCPYAIGFDVGPLRAVK